MFEEKVNRLQNLSGHARNEECERYMELHSLALHLGDDHFIRRVWVNTAVVSQPPRCATMTRRTIHEIWRGYAFGTPTASDVNDWGL
jgi:hypothetical protein